jgi:hypothetical protein
MTMPHAIAAATWVVALIAEQLRFALEDEDGDGQGFALVGAQVCIVSWGNNAEGVICWAGEVGGEVIHETETIEEMAAWLALQ